LWGRWEVLWGIFVMLLGIRMVLPFSLVGMPKGSLPFHGNKGRDVEKVITVLVKKSDLRMSSEESSDHVAPSSFCVAEISR
jgi:hypothetical protein